LLVVHLTDELVDLYVYRIMLSAFHDDRLAVLREPGTLDLQFQALSIILLQMSVEDLETAVSHLSAVEFARFREWFDEFAADQWDRQIEADMRAGRFDAAGKRADEDFEAGRCKPL
jgi:hypothetical protein